jgi:hypothetical protein
MSEVEVVMRFKEAPMYDVFDSFIDIETWHTRHPSDLSRFYKALNQAVWSDNFNPDEMADYLRHRRKIPTEDHESKFAKTIDRYRDDAWAVKDFLKQNKISGNPKADIT